MASSIAAQQANHLRADLNLVGITADRLMAITPPGASFTMARRGALSSSGRTRRGYYN